MIAHVLLLMVATYQSESCEVVRADHEQFKLWASREMQRLEPSRPNAPTEAERVNWRAFEQQIESRISNLNRRYANCQKN